MPYWSYTHVGLRRENNEDALLAQADLNLYGVADGMGGHAAGEVASAEAVHSIARALEPHRELITRFRNPSNTNERDQLTVYLRQALDAANQAIHSHARGRRMGTTFCGGIVNGLHALIANVGDSRCYLMRSGRLYQITQDHTLVGEQLRQGLITEEQAEKSPHRHILLKALGTEVVVDADVIPVDLCVGDRLLFCSDGVHGQVPWSSMGTILGDGNGQRAVECLIEEANRAGGTDNATAVLLEIDNAAQTMSTEHLIDPEAKIQALWQLPLFQSLDYAELMKLVAVTASRSWRAGQQVFAENDQGDSLVVVLEGEFKVTSGSRVLAVVPPGDHVGELALMDGAPRSATVVANVASKGLVIKRGPFFRLLRRETGMASKLLWHFGAHMATRIRTLTNQLRTTSSRA